jgi:hypothetical protein
MYSQLKEDDSRLERFQQLDTKTQYSLFFPHQVDTGKLPSVPKGWGKLEEQAVESTIRHIRDPAIAKNRLGVQSNNELEDSDDNDYARLCRAPTPMQGYEDFVTALPLCVPMTIGFLAKDGESQSCYCPCSKVMSN